MSDRDFDAVTDLFRGSLAYRMSRPIIDRSAAAVSESVSVNRWRSISSAFAAQSAQQQIQAVAMTIAVASLAHLAIRELLPRYATSGLPWWWNVTVAVFAAAVAALAGPIASASAGSTPAKLWRRLTA